ncbi:MAG: type II secretion system protein [bacterium]|nr:type II secretion system protein [bacterium]
MNPFNVALARRHRGFTLIELLIVISILVILSVAVAMNFIGFDYDARHSSTKSNIASLRSAISLYRSRHSKFPEPKASGGRKATQGGEHTLEAILTNTGTFGDNTEYIRGNIAGELISSSKENGYVCVVEDLASYYGDNSTFDNCLNASSEETISEPGGYVYCAINGAIRLNFAVEGDDLRNEDQTSIGSLVPDWQNWESQKDGADEDWPVRW